MHNELVPSYLHNSTVLSNSTHFKTLKSAELFPKAHIYDMLKWSVFGNPSFHTFIAGKNLILSSANTVLIFHF